MRLEGLLVDLVPIDKRFDELEHKWENGEAAFWGDAGGRNFFSHASVEAHQKERAEERAKGGTTWVGLGIQTKAGQPIGVFFLGNMNPYHRTAMFGAQIGEPDYWGGGYGTDALLLAADYAFNWLDLRKVWLGTMRLNVRVIRQMEKVGFTLEGTQRGMFLAEGVWYDHLMYGMLADDWPGYAAMIDKLGLKVRP
ncbi:MAG: GNAT family N-acetyltransferase [Chloroflexi bacterium]|nr:GNAT family N-acetyltransferase [Chloroflexota bacterium]